MVLIVNKLGYTKQKWHTPAVAGMCRMRLFLNLSYKIVEDNNVLLISVLCKLCESNVSWVLY